MTAPELGTYAWKQLRKRVYAEETHCWLCGVEVDFTAPPRSPRSPTADHVLPRSLGGAPYDRDNVRLACHRCNSYRQAGKRVTRSVPLRTSRVW